MQRGLSNLSKVSVMIMLPPGSLHVLWVFSMTIQILTINNQETQPLR